VGVSNLQKSLIKRVACDIFHDLPLGLVKTALGLYALLYEDEKFVFAFNAAVKKLFRSPGVAPHVTALSNGLEQLLTVGIFRTSSSTTPGGDNKFAMHRWITGRCFPDNLGMNLLHIIEYWLLLANLLPEFHCPLLDVLHKVTHLNDKKVTVACYSHAPLDLVVKRYIPQLQILLQRLHFRVHGRPFKSIKLDNMWFLAQNQAYLGSLTLYETNPWEPPKSCPGCSQEAL